MKRGTTDRMNESINGGTNDRMNKTMNKRIYVFVLLTRRTLMLFVNKENPHFKENAFRD